VLGTPPAPPLLEPAALQCPAAGRGHSADAAAAQGERRLRAPCQCLYMFVYICSIYMCVYIYAIYSMYICMYVCMYVCVCSVPAPHPGPRVRGHASALPVQSALPAQRRSRTTLSRPSWHSSMQLWGPHGPRRAATGTRGGPGRCAGRETEVRVTSQVRVPVGPCFPETDILCLACIHYLISGVQVSNRPLRPARQDLLESRLGRAGAFKFSGFLTRKSESEIVMDSGRPTGRRRGAVMARFIHRRLG
jgi:hypothetical protein